MRIEKFVDDFFYRKVSTHHLAKLTGFSENDKGLLIVYTVDGESKEYQATFMEMILYVARYGNS